MVLSQFLGICSFLGVSKSMKAPAALGGAVIFVMTIASAVASLLYDYVLVPLGKLEFMKTIIFILVIAALVQIVEMFIKKTSPALYQALGIYLPLITTNCAVLGVALPTYRTAIISSSLWLPVSAQPWVIPSPSSCSPAAVSALMKPTFPDRSAAHLLSCSPQR